MFKTLLFVLSCFLITTSFINAQLQYATPVATGLDSNYIQKKVDSIMTLGIKENDFPRAQFLVAKNNKINFQPSYDYHT